MKKEEPRMEIEKIWWEQTTTPEQFIKKIADTLNQGRSILIPDYNSIPWQSHLIEKIYKECKKSYETITITDSKPIDECILEKEHELEKDSHIKHPGKTNVEFLARKKSVFHDMSFLIHLNKNRLNECLDFIKEYKQLRDKKGEYDKAVFLLLLNSEKCGMKKIPENEAIDILPFKQTEYDRTIFAMLTIDYLKNNYTYTLEKNGNNFFESNNILKKYFVELACDVAGENVELCSECLLQHDRFLKKPFDAIRGIIDNSTDSNGNNFVFFKTEDEIKEQIDKLKTEIKNRLSEIREKIEIIQNSEVTIAGIKHEIDEIKDTISKIIKMDCEVDTIEDRIEKIKEEPKNKMEQSILTAQIRIFYPLLEEFRQHLIKKYRNKIEKLLPISLPTIPGKKDAERKTYEGSIEDFELIDFVRFFMDAKQLEPKIDPKDDIDLLVFHKARNALSHYNSLLYENESDRLFSEVFKLLQNPNCEKKENSSKESDKLIAALDKRIKKLDKFRSDGHWHPSITTLLNTFFIKKIAN